MDLPADVQRHFRFARPLVQSGYKHDTVKVPKVFVAAVVLELFEDKVVGIHRALKNDKFAEVVLVLYCFQGKTKRSIATMKE